MGYAILRTLPATGPPSKTTAATLRMVTADTGLSGYPALSPDGKLVYGIRPGDSGETLFSLDVATGAEKIVGNMAKEYFPRSNLNPTTRFSLAPDGKSIAYSVGNFKDNLWLLEGFAAKSGWLARLGL